MLMNHTDFQVKSILWRLDNHLFAVNKDLTVIWEINTRDHVHKRCFSASVLTEDRKNFALVYGKIDILVGNN